MGKIKGMKDIETKPNYIEDDIMAEEQIKSDPKLKYNHKIKIKAYEECVEVIDKYIREKQKTRNIFYVTDLNELKNRIIELEEKEDGKKTK